MLLIHERSNECGCDKGSIAVGYCGSLPAVPDEVVHLEDDDDCLGEISTLGRVCSHLESDQTHSRRTTASNGLT